MNKWDDYNEDDSIPDDFRRGSEDIDSYIRRDSLTGLLGGEDPLLGCHALNGTRTSTLVLLFTQICPL